jgi:hypothetical protein
LTIHQLRSAPPDWLGQALEKFEAQFRYPLGPNASFAVSHGRDYLPFFAAIGEATVLVAEHEGRVLATVAAVLRPLRGPDGCVHTTAYLADLKVAPVARGGTVLARVFLALRELLTVNSAYGIVMDGTGATPLSYTGRFGIPAFVPVGKLAIFCISVSPEAPILAAVESDRLREPAGYLPRGGTPQIRSERIPTALASDEASGLLEDTRLGKRLMRGANDEMRAAHLSRLVWQRPGDAADVVRQAVGLCAREGVPTLFSSVPQSVAPSLERELDDLRFELAPATVFGCGLAPDQPWWVDSAEI